MFSKRFSKQSLEDAELKELQSCREDILKYRNILQQKTVFKDEIKDILKVFCGDCTGIDDFVYILKTHYDDVGIKLRYSSLSDVVHGERALSAPAVNAIIGYYNQMLHLINEQTEELERERITLESGGNMDDFEYDLDEYVGA